MNNLASLLAFACLLAGCSHSGSNTRVKIVNPEFTGVGEQEAVPVRARLLKEVEGHYSELIECYDHGREHNGTLHGRVTVKFTVAPSGEVVGLSDGGGTTMPSSDVIDCVQGAFTRMKFASWEGKPVVAVLPIEFVVPGLVG